MFRWFLFLPPVSPLKWYQPPGSHTRSGSAALRLHGGIPPHWSRSGIPYTSCRDPRQSGYAIPPHRGRSISRCHVKDLRAWPCAHPNRSRLPADRKAVPPQWNAAMRSARSLYGTSCVPADGSTPDGSPAHQPLRLPLLLLPGSSHPLPSALSPPSPQSLPDGYAHPRSDVQGQSLQPLFGSDQIRIIQQLPVCHQWSVLHRSVSRGYGYSAPPFRWSFLSSHRLEAVQRRLWSRPHDLPRISGSHWPHTPGLSCPRLPWPAAPDPWPSWLCHASRHLQQFSTDILLLVRR